MTIHENSLHHALLDRCPICADRDRDAAASWLVGEANLTTVLHMIAEIVVTTGANGPSSPTYKIVLWKI